MGLLGFVTIVSIGLMPLALNGDLLDAGLATRSMWLSAMSGIFLLVLFFEARKDKEFKLGYPLGMLFLLAWWLWQWVGHSEATAKGESLLVILRNGALLAWMFGLFTALRNRLLDRLYLTIGIMFFAGITSIHALFEILSKLGGGQFALDIYTVHGLFQHKNLLSGILLILLPMMALAAIRLRGWRQTLSIGILVLIVLEIITLRTRAVWIALVLGGAFSLGLMYYTKAVHPRFNLNLKRLWPLGVLFLGLFVVSIVYNQKAQSAALGSFESRLGFWESTLEMVGEKPFSGVGSGQWRIQFPKYGLEHTDARIMSGETSIQRPHNDYLWMAAEQGLPGLLFYLSAMFWLVVGLARKTAEAKAAQQAPAELWLFWFGLVAFNIYMLGDFPYERSAHMMMYFGFLSAVFVFVDIKKREYTFPLLPTILILVMLSGASFYVWNQRVAGESKALEVLTYNKRQDVRIVAAVERAENEFFRLDNFTNPLRYYSGLGRLHIQKDFVGAEADFNSALDLHPYHFLSYNQLGNLKKAQGQKDEAFRHYSRAVEISPDFELGRLNMAEMLFADAKVEEAFEWLHGCALSTQNSKFMALAREMLPVWIELKAFNGAKTPLVEALKPYANDKQALFNAYMNYRMAKAPKQSPANKRQR